MRLTVLPNLLICCAFFWCAGTVAAEKDTAKNAVSDPVELEIIGRIYPIDGAPSRCREVLKGGVCNEAPFGTFHVIARKEGDAHTSVTTFTGPDGVQVTETSTEKNGRVRKAVAENLALGKRSEIEVRDGKVFYRVTDLSDGSVKTSVDEAEDNLVVPSTVMAYVSPRFADLEAGKEIPLKIAVLERRESFRFVMRKFKMDKAADGSPIMVLEMKPTSFIVRALVDPMYFHVKTRTGELAAYEGRSALRRKENGTFREINVRTAYEYKVNRFPGANITQTQNCTIQEPVPGMGGKCEAKAQ
jgi:hypothetical protein